MAKEPLRAEIPQQADELHELVGVFDDQESLQNAIAELELAGFDRRHLSVLGSDKALESQFGTAQIDRQSLEDSACAPRRMEVKKQEVGVAQGVLIGGGMLVGVIGAIVATGGLALPGAIVTTVAVGTGGGAVGAVLAKILGDKYGEFFQKQIDQGGLLLWVNLTDTAQNDEAMEQKAREILAKHGARDTHTHRLPAHQVSSVS